MREEGEGGRERIDVVEGRNPSPPTCRFCLSPVSEGKKGRKEGRERGVSPINLRVDI